VSIRTGEFATRKAADENHFRTVSVGRSVSRKLNWQE